MIHLTFTTLLNLLGNLPPSDARAAAEAHLASPCPQCQADLARVRMLLDLLSREDNTVAPPEHVVRRVIATFRAQISSSSLRRIVASLLFDNFRQAPLAAVRGVARSRQLLFSTEGLDIDVQITSESGSATLIGQALDRDRASVEPRPFVRLYHSGGEVLDASEADAHGQFAFHAVPPGVYNLGVELGATEIVLEDLELAND